MDIKSFKLKVQIFSLFGLSIRTYDDSNNLIYLAKEASFSKSLLFTIYNSTKNKLETIKGRSTLNKELIYDVIDNNGVMIALFDVHGISEELARTEIDIKNSQGELLGKFLEDSVELSVARRYSSKPGLLFFAAPVSYSIQWNGQEIGKATRTRNFLQYVYEVNLNAEIFSLQDKILPALLNFIVICKTKDISINR